LQRKLLYFTTDFRDNNSTANDKDLEDSRTKVQQLAASNEFFHRMKYL